MYDKLELLFVIKPCFSIHRYLIKISNSYYVHDIHVTIEAYNTGGGISGTVSCYAILF